jgi:adenylate kinase
VLRLVFLGPPGAGKGTIAGVLIKELNVPQVSTGDMLRDAIRHAKPLGLRAKEFMEKGQLVPDEIVIQLVAERLKGDAKNGFILDGFPRTPEQARSLDKTLHDHEMPLDLAIYFRTSLPMIIKRLSGRRICGQCGKNYHTTNFRPKKEGVCDACGSKLIQRADDHEDVVTDRLRVYERQTAPLIEYYREKGNLAEVDGDLDVEPLIAILKDLFAKRIGHR